MKQKRDKPKGPPTHGQKIRARRWAVVGLAALVALDIALVTVALGDRATPSNVGEPVGASPVAEPSSTPTPAATPEVLETQAPLASAVAPTRTIAALDGSTAWRAQTGTCPTDAATVQLTTDAGAEWKSFDASISTGASRILSINALGAATASMVTLQSEQCAPQVVVTFVGGEEWADQSERLSGNWYIDPNDAAVVHSPVGAFGGACGSAVALAARTDLQAAVVCDDGNVFRTEDGGAVWQQPVEAPGAANVAINDSGYFLAMTNQAGCDGVQLTGISATGSDALTPISCIEAAFEPGEIALAFSDEAVWLWAGEQLVRSGDGGATWQ